ncbi:ribonuclease G, partial [Xanthomonas vesicatoria]
MSEEILVNVTPRETRVAVIENGMLQELHIERGWRRGVVGNIYKGKVQRVMPGMQAAFVEVGLERAAFLHANDVVRLAPAPASVVDTEETPIPPPPAASVPIVELLRDGQDIVVQVVKDPIGTKGARLTTQISIPSRYLVLLPQSKIVGVSARIEDEAERLRLKTIVSEVSAQHGGFGYIIRTNAEGQPAEALAEDIAYLSRVWTVVERRGREAPPCSIIYEDLSLPLRAVRDLIRKDVEKVKVDSNETFVQLQAFVAKYMPVLAERLELYTGDRPIFDLYGVEDEIGRALNKQVPLKSGGYLVIDQTEAMTTIDVNTGSFVGQRNLEETVFRTNLEAAQAVARQLRLRNLGGIIIIDFIDMDDPEHRRQVLRTLEKALARDHAKTTVYEFSPLGLVEMTRKRTVESLERQLSETCGQCGGRGTIKTAETVTYEIFREITRAVRQ